MIAARSAADYLGTAHQEFVFTVQEGLDALPEVIHHLETYDVTTIRASTPMYLLSRKIKAMGVKMVLSGEGSDEILGGNFVIFRFTLFLFFFNIVAFRLPLLPRSSGFCFVPSRMYTSGEEPSYVRLFTCQQVISFFLSPVEKSRTLTITFRSTMAWGLEARVPFLDKAFLEVAMNIDPKEKMFTKKSERVYDKEGREKMEKVRCQPCPLFVSDSFVSSMSFAKRLMFHPTTKWVRL